MNKKKNRIKSRLPFKEGNVLAEGLNNNKWSVDNNETW